jgi:beta-glucanase (GH16 family)
MNRQAREPRTARRLSVFVLTGAVAVLAATPASAQWTLVWSDEFNGPNGAAPDGSKWTYDTGAGGWGNGELQTYCAPGSNTAPCSAANPNAYQSGGQLVVRARNSGGAWTSARLKTQGVAQFQYGRIEARMKLPVGAGLWPAFWMLGTDIGSVGWPQCGELDIMEWVQQYGPSVTSSTIHGPGYSGGGGIGQSFTFPNGGRTDTDFHVYGVVWSPNRVDFYRDDVNAPFFTVTPGNIPGGTQWVYNHPFFLILNLAIGGGGFPGNTNSSTPNPALMLVDYVRVYQAATTPGLNGAHTLTPQHATGKRMDLSGAQVFNGNKVQIWTANGTGAQSWNFSNAGVVPSGNYNIATSLGAYCLDVAAAGTANGTKVQLYQCNGTNAQSWRAVPVGGNVYELRPANAPNSCLDVTGVSTTDGTQLQIWQCGGGANQRWSIN